MNLFRIFPIVLLLFCGSLHFTTYGMDDRGPNSANPSSTTSGKKSDGQNAPHLFSVPKPPSDLTAKPYYQIQERNKKALQGNRDAMKEVFKEVEGGVLYQPFTWDEIMEIPSLKTNVLGDDGDGYIHLIIQYYISVNRYCMEIPGLPFFDDLKEKVVKLANQGSAVHQYFAGVILGIGKRDIGRSPRQENEPVLLPLSKEDTNPLIYPGYGAPNEEKLQEILNRVFYDNLRPRYDISTILTWCPNIKDKVVGEHRDLRKVNWILKCAKKVDDLSAIPGLVAEIQQNAQAGSEIDQYFVREIEVIKEYEENKKQSHEYFTKSADQDYAPAHFALTNFGKRFEDILREGLTPEVQEELKALKSAVELGYAPAQYFLGLFHRIHVGDKEACKDIMYKAAKQGHPFAQSFLGGFYIPDSNNPHLNLIYKPNPSVGFAWHWMSRDLSCQDIGSVMNNEQNKLFQIIQRNP